MRDSFVEAEKLTETGTYLWWKDDGYWGKSNPNSEHALPLPHSGKEGIKIVNRNFAGGIIYDWLGCRLFHKTIPGRTPRADL